LQSVLHLRLALEDLLNEERCSCDEESGNSTRWFDSGEVVEHLSPKPILHKRDQDEE
jgi:hypothetical protein